MSEPTFELTRVGPTRLTLPNCPGCDLPLPTDDLVVNEETSCPRCGVVLLLVRIDGVLMFLRDGWT